MGRYVTLHKRGAVQVLVGRSITAVGRLHVVSRAEGREV